MAITAHNIKRIGNHVRVSVTSDNFTAPGGAEISRLGPSGGMPRPAADFTARPQPAVIFYHWYLDGILIASTVSPAHSFYVPAGEKQMRLEVLDTLDPDFDTSAAAPAGYPARRKLFWVRSQDADIDHYRIEQQKDGGGWAALDVVPHMSGRWSYSYVTGRLTDLSTYSWRVVPVDRIGDDGTPLALGSEKLVRPPDPPNFSATFDLGTTKVTFAEVA